MSRELGGPYVTVAAICEAVLEQTDGTISVIRIIDRITVGAGADAPEVMPTITVNTKLVLLMRSGNTQGNYNIRLVSESPNGTETPLGTIPVLFEGQERGNHITLNLAFQANEQGLYWFAVYVEDQFMTRIPLRVIYQRIVGPLRNP